MDVEDIAPGDRFAKTIDETIAGCNIVLIVIGPRWAEILRQRARGPKRDYVSDEIEAALARQIKIVPVLVGGAGMAQLENLPEKLSALTQYEAAELRDSTFTDDCTRLAGSLRLQPAVRTETGSHPAARRKALVILAATVLVAVLLAASAWMRVGPLGEYRARRDMIRQMLATARTQAGRAEYESAFRTYQGLLKTDPGNRAAIELQADAAMGWLENFHVLSQDNGARAEDVAAGLLMEITPVLDAALARSNGEGPRAADILAHTGWAHWLNQRIAQKEFGNAAERDFRDALRLDPSNVFAHAMLGNYLMQTGGKTGEALLHFRLAAETDKERAFVRRLQLGAMIYPRDPETRAALIRVANEMRRNGEPLDDGQKHRILNTFDPTVNSAAEISQTLSAVPPDDAWATYVWLDSNTTDADDLSRRVHREFVKANLLNIQGKRQEALAAFENLQRELKTRGYNGRIATEVESAIKQLSAK